jgi:nucleotide-binding universal stress UspA family protein
MTLLIAVADAAADGELVAAGRSLAKAAGWEARAVHVRETGGPELDRTGFGDLELADLAGDPVTTLAGLAGEPGVDAIAVGLRGGGSGSATAARATFGHVTAALLVQIRAPLLLVRPGMRPVTGLRRLLVPLEGSPSASASMTHADDAFCARGREIVMLHVVTGDLPTETGSLPAPRIVDQEHYEWPAWQDEFRMRFSQCPEGGRHSVRVRVGEPAAVIVEEARSEDAELIVVSLCGPFEEGRAPIVHRLLDTAPCPLLVVPSPAPVS